MDVYEELKSSFYGVNSTPIRTVTMHTTGEPTRIVVSGYPVLDGDTLLEKRHCARRKYDGIRKRLMHEPRGHRDMYGAILVQDSELIRAGDADIAVLFMHNEGYSTMCGHATIALGRFLIDTHDLALFPVRERLHYDPGAKTTFLRLHAPCGVVRLTVPTIKGVRADGSPSLERSDSSRPVSFLSVPSFPVAIDLEFPIPTVYQWPELIAKPGIRDGSISSSAEPAEPTVKLDIAYGGAFYAIVNAAELGFQPQPSATTDTSGVNVYDRETIKALDHATGLLKACIQDTPTLASLLRHPTEQEMEFLYGVTVVDAYPHSGQDPRRRTGTHDQYPATIAHSELDRITGSDPRLIGSDVSLCFFADQQLDRSPTGSCVSARVALAVARGDLALGDTWAYHSVISVRHGGGEGAFLGTAAVKVRLASERGESRESVDAVEVKVQGKAWYIGKESYLVENGDPVGDGFLIG